MKRLILAFGVPLILAVGPGQGDTGLSAVLPAPADYAPLSSRAPLPGTLAQVLAPKAKTPKVMPPDQQQALQRDLKGLQIRTAPQPLRGRGPGDTIPHTYLVFGLRTGPGGMAFTDRNGVAISVPSNPQIILKPFNGIPAVPPPIYILPPTLTLPPPAPKK